MSVLYISFTVSMCTSLISFSEDAFSKPLCFAAEDPRLLERALRLYQGRALYDGPLSEAELAPLVRRYGLIV